MSKELVFRTTHRYTSSVMDADDIRTIDDPKKLISVLLTYASELSDMSYSTREKIFDQSGIDKFSLDEGFQNSRHYPWGMD